MKRIVLCMSLVAAACGREQVDVAKGDPTNDYNQDALQTAIDEFVANGRSAQAFADLAKQTLALRPGMDRTVADQAELKLIVLALQPMQAVQSKAMAEQVETLALTVWPTLLAPRITADGVLIKRDPKAALLLPQTGEDPRQYIQRLCGGPLAGDCKQIVPEYQAEIIAAIATRRATERARNAVSSCVMCGAEPGWHEAVRAWESLDRIAAAKEHDVERKGAPENWPIAGPAAETGAAMEDPTALWREAQINAVGEVVIGGQRYTGEARIEALRDLRSDSDTIALHLRPELSLAQVKGIVADAKKGGATKVAVVARAPQYPWERRVYWLSDAGKTRVNLRPTDSLQLLLHTIDHVAAPGSIARVD
ncbi:MAG: hypothetical protein H0T46_05905 [Deltaproteobacteria bacterium]|nr:hypothetical protein [Deltaproteobacteria bacterium]